MKAILPTLPDPLSERRAHLTGALKCREVTAFRHGDGWLRGYLLQSLATEEEG